MFNIEEVNIIINALDQWEVEYCPEKNKKTCGLLLNYFKNVEAMILKENFGNTTEISHNACVAIQHSFDKVRQSLHTEDSRKLCSNFIEEVFNLCRTYERI